MWIGLFQFKFADNAQPEIEIENAITNLTLEFELYAQICHVSNKNEMGMRFYFCYIQNGPIRDLTLA